MENIYVIRLINTVCKHNNTVSLKSTMYLVLVVIHVQVINKTNIFSTLHAYTGRILFTTIHVRAISIIFN